MHNACLHTATWLLPAPSVAPRTWACVACDQFTAQPLYWREVEALVGDNPSALRLILPEVYLSDAAERIPAIHRAMQDYLTRGVLREAVTDGFVLVQRRTDAGVSLGLVGVIDLEGYDYRAGSQSPVRATEGTIVERIPPRLAVRRGAALETGHVLLLIDDPAMTVLEPLAGRVAALETLYDFPLMMGGGHLTGYAVTAQDDVQGVFSALDALWQQKPEGIRFAVGDGNHSLATAKAYWQESRQTLTDSQRETHPARYAMVEVQNIHSPALVFEPIHRLVSGYDGDDLLDDLSAYASQHGMSLASGEQGERMTVVYEGKEVTLSIAGSPHPLAVGTLQAFLDDWLAAHPHAALDYVHGEVAARTLAQQADTVAFLLPAMDKAALLPAVERLGALPRKTFSMGEAHQKRYYMEARKLG